MSLPPSGHQNQYPTQETARPIANPQALGMAALHIEERRVGYLRGMPDYAAEDRGAISRLKGYDRKLAVGFLALSELPDDLRAEIAGGPRPANNEEVLHRLGGTGTPEASAPPKNVFLKFARWHRENLIKKQAEFETTRLPAERRFFRHAVEKAARSWLPATAVAKLERIETAQVFLDDGFDTLFKGRGGYARFDSGHDGKRHIIALAPDAGKGTVVHEFSHGLAGTDDVPEGEAPGKEHRGLHRIFGTGQGGEAVEEAVNDHIALTLQHGNVETTNPNSKHRRYREAYILEGKLLHALCTKGIRKISPRLFIAAQLEDGADRDAAGPNSAQAKLVEALHEAFPDGDIIKAIASPDFESPSLFALKLSRQYEGRRFVARLLLKRRSR